MLSSAFNTTIAFNRGLNPDNHCPYREIYRSILQRVQTYPNVSARNGSCQIVNHYRDDRSRTNRISTYEKVQVGNDQEKA